MTTKICSKCKKELNTTEFGKYSKNKDGKRYTCLVCTNESNRVYREKSKENGLTTENIAAIKKRRQKYYQNNKEVLKKSARAYYKRHKDEINKKGHVRRVEYDCMRRIRSDVKLMEEFKILNDELVSPDEVVRLDDLLDENWGEE
jgi:hypothetical protein